MRLAAINIHPVKSTAIRSVAEAYVGRSGLVGDREWMVVDGAGKLVSARELRELFTIVADTPSTGGRADLRLSAPGHKAIELTLPTEGVRDIQMFNRVNMRGRSMGPEADAWLREVLGREDLSLVWCHDPFRRVLDTKDGFTASDHATFQDESPLSLITDASVAAIDGWSEATITAQRFRPSLRVEGAEEAFAEDGWKEVGIGPVRFRMIAPISRCVMTTIDPVTLEKDKEPLRTLAIHRKWDGKTWAAVHLAVVHPGEIAVGDEVIVS
ncbi:MAG: MOSC domain-containing protein [Nocardioides sp.]|uniref:MOSC domain-containing protein n=1 Tax=Nocardioides sp. TaxID=35761 RepID=UPI003D6AA8F0